MHEIRLSIIIPIYNCSEYLDRCLNSLLNQTVKNKIEIILVDDGSTDDSLEKCLRYQLQYNDVKVISQNNQGASKARIEGIKIATGAYVSFVDSDDWVSNDIYEHLLQMIERLDVDILQYGYEQVTNKSKKIIENYEIEDAKIFTAREAIWQLYGEHCEKKFNFLLWNKIYKRELFDNIILPEERLLINDVPFIPRIFFEAHKIGTCDWKGYYYLQRNSEKNKSTMDSIKDNYAKMSYEHYKAFKNVSEYFRFIDKEIYDLTMKYTLVYSISVLKSRNKDKNIIAEVKYTIRNASKRAVRYLPLKKQAFCYMLKIYY